MPASELMPRRDSPRPHPATYREMQVLNPNTSPSLASFLSLIATVSTSFLRLLNATPTWTTSLRTSRGQDHSGVRPGRSPCVARCRLVAKDSPQQSPPPSSASSTPTPPPPRPPPLGAQSPFEFCVMEVTLEAICSFLDARTIELETNAYPALDELTSKPVLSDEAMMSRLVGALITFKPLYSVLKLASREAAAEAKPATMSIAKRAIPEATSIEEANQIVRGNWLNVIEEHHLKYLGSSQVNDILDIGCSVGVSTRYLVEKFPSAQAVGLDLSPYFLAVEAQKEEKLSRPKPIRWVHANGEATGLSSDSFDLVSLAYVCHECPARAITRLVKEAFRVLRPGGTIALTDNSHVVFEEQFGSGRLLAYISARPGQCGRADGYILEGKELEFYMKKLQRTGDAEDRGDDEVSGLRVAAEAWATFRRQ
uniref:Methyltransferase type 11 domain-containing protein n=1 Tax=Zea mays TaxID=4577 RepID=A0A804N1A5_MAIZE